MSFKECAVFVDIDTQFDFMNPEGSLYIKNAEKIVPNIRRLIDFALKNKIPVIASVDAHMENDPEFEKFPPHCIKGKPGYEKIPETRVQDYEIIENKPMEIEVSPGKEIIIEKQAFSLFENINTENILKKIGRTIAVIFGVATEYCVRASALGFLERGYKVFIVTDAIKEISKEEGEKALEELKNKGAKLITTDQILKGKT
ncbi:cysteine hydrolase [Candidatus Aminicenantes bacterium AC-708-M15]|jgi:nicotinamidase/pyrazinamidase|nr:cysteine hydrolase [SCandidatus Aminicenantes bacterium Aminicenantia_JdfR_composite]MCP2597283.1 cysteine hydrolase [Candidatus Aminicenantes bacterium AC-335-G13]MCP2598409.1 cysteine hydrolase [Candidatus Aminicenantes bacterium AC-335-L06]MCP2604062.1 cysteine hydrolase [Candidatus Aminicenantes bacterium AC-708-M15]MCP2605886.1 cysteine hydrolase [Candidatus Aminicenantes bacterium AC-335-O07]MCP2618307.1 cysteine hydrolase [Candidatus Aminicenantes bacterium AC-335-A11]MCP2621154.1 c